MTDKVKTNKSQQTIFSQNVKQALDQQVDALNSDTLHRLRDARNMALNQKNQYAWMSKKWLTGAGAGLAIASLLAFIVVPQLTASKLSPLDDLEILSAEADVDLYTQLDFYQWLDESLNES